MPQSLLAHPGTDFKHSAFLVAPALVNSQECTTVTLPIPPQIKSTPLLLPRPKGKLSDVPNWVLLNYLVKFPLSSCLWCW